MISKLSACLTFVVIICTLVSILLLSFSYKKGKNNYNLLLALFFILLAYPCFVLLLITTGYIEQFPHFYRTGIMGHLIYPAVSYLYFRSVLSKKGLTKYDFFHLIPVLVYIIDYFDFFFLPGGEKVAFMKSNQISNMVLFFYESRFFMPGFYVILKYILALAYWIMQTILLIRIKSPEFKKENRLYLKWMILFLISEIFLFVPFNILKPGYGDDAITIFVSVGGLTGLTSIFLFLFPQILYGINGIVLTNMKSDKINSDYSISNSTHSQKEPPSSRYLSKMKMEEILLIVKNNLDDQKSFLDRKYNIQQLASEISIPAYHISAVINECEKVNFNDFVNAYRVKHCIELLNNNDHRNQTLEALANESGFNNRNTFTIAFKKVMNQTPSEYIKSIKKGLSDN